MQQGIKVDILNNVLFSNNDFQHSLEIELNIIRYSIVTP